MAFTDKEWESIEVGREVGVITGPGYAPTRDHATKVGKVVKKVESEWGPYCVIEFEDGTQDTMHSVRDAKTERAIGYYLLDDEKPKMEPLSVTFAKEVNDEIWSAAKWCARRGYKGERGDPLPDLMSSRACDRLDANMRWFRKLVKEAKAEIEPAMMDKEFQSMADNLKAGTAWRLTHEKLPGGDTDRFGDLVWLLTSILSSEYPQIPAKEYTVFQHQPGSRIGASIVKRVENPLAELEKVQARRCQRDRPV